MSKIEVNLIIDSEILPGLKSFLGDDIHLETKEIKNCSVEDCDCGYYAKGYCQPHYRKFKAYGDPLYIKPVVEKVRKVKVNTRHERKEWNRIKAICYDPRHGLYPRYGGKGVTMCDSWLNSFDEFYKDMSVQPASGDIVDTDSNIFNKENCAWKTFKEFQEDNIRRASKKLKNR